ncbi:hypothetical protein SPFM20_00252 [Salmonella phage SPFM20]|nr:hypothetical protein SPFM8_00251 [Salmonella phage SPFM8]VFR14930.1 hypothetical protein SPFM20_00252 [Salmonella phage SPFM20]
MAYRLYSEKWHDWVTVPHYELYTYVLWNENPAGSVDQNNQRGLTYYVTRTSSIRNTSSTINQAFHYYMVTEHYSGLFLNILKAYPGVEDVAKKLCTDAPRPAEPLPPYIGMTLASFLEYCRSVSRHPPTL